MMPDNASDSEQLTLAEYARQLGKTEADTLATLPIEQLHATVNANGAHHVNVAQGSNPTVSTTIHVTLPRDTTLRVGQAKRNAAEALIETTRAYIDGLNTLARPLNHNPNAQTIIETLAEPVVRAVQLAIEHNVDAVVIAECLANVGKTLQSFPNQEFRFDSDDRILGRGAYLIILSAFSLAVLNERFDLLRILVEHPIRHYGVNELPLGAVRAYFFFPTISNQAERDAFYARLFDAQSGWLAPSLPIRMDRDKPQVELDFIAELAYAHAYAAYYPTSTTMHSAGGRYLFDLLGIQDYIRTNADRLKQAFPGTRATLERLVRAYDANPATRGRLSSAFASVLPLL